MADLRDRSRLVFLVAIGLALLFSGVVTSAAGGNFILGQANSAGTSNTSLTTSSDGNALLVAQNGPGAAIRGSTGSGAGVAGFFSSGSGSGVVGVVANKNSYGVYAANDGVTSGAGAALRANGKQNEGIIATSDQTNAVRGVVTGCAGPLCGGNGVSGTGFGSAAGVYGDGTDAVAALWASEGLTASVYAVQSGAGIPAVLADSAAGVGVIGRGGGGSADISIDTQAGGQFVGLNGIYGLTDSAFGVGVYGRSNGGRNLAMYSDGDAYINGDISLAGSCTGCVAATLAVNGSTSTLKRGDAVAIDGLRETEDGTIVLVVRAARRGDAIVGVVDRELKATTATTTVGGEKRTIKVNRAADLEITTPTGTLTAPKGLWEEGAMAVGADAFLRVITSGVFAFDAAAPPGAAVGDSLAVGGSTGQLGKAAANSTVTAGRYLGRLDDGRVVLLVSPS